MAVYYLNNFLEIIIHLYFSMFGHADHARESGSCFYIKKPLFMYGISIIAIRRSHGHGYVITLHGILWSEITCRCLNTYFWHQGPHIGGKQLESTTNYFTFTQGLIQNSLHTLYKCFMRYNSGFIHIFI